MRTNLNPLEFVKGDTFTIDIASPTNQLILRPSFSFIHVKLREMVEIWPFLKFTNPLHISVSFKTTLLLPALILIENLHTYIYICVYV